MVAIVPDVALEALMTNLGPFLMMLVALVAGLAMLVVFDTPCGRPLPGRSPLRRQRSGCALCASPVGNAQVNLT
jgi:hypothetical protein